jgi:hypothetical protein
MRALIYTLAVFGGLAAGVALAFLFVNPLNTALDEVLAYRNLNQQLDEILIAGVVSAIDMQAHALVLDRPNPLEPGAIKRIRIHFGELPVTVSRNYSDSHLAVQKAGEELVGAHVRILITNREGALIATAIARASQ